MQGPPGCGKSTQVKYIYEALGKESTVIISRDAIRLGRGDYWVPSQEQWVTLVENDMAHNAADCGYNIIIDATNLNPKVIVRWEAFAEVYGYTLIKEPIYRPLEWCVEADKGRERSVGKDIIESFFDRYNINKITGEY